MALTQKVNLFPNLTPPKGVVQHPVFKRYYVSRDGEAIYRTPGPYDHTGRWGEINEWGAIKLNYGLQGNLLDRKYYYYCVNVSHHDEDGNKIKQTTRSVHLMVADCFMRPPLPGEEICHGAKGHRCNHVDNLRWGTHTSNMAETRGRVRGVVRRKRVFGTGVGNLTPLINEA